MKNRQIYIGIITLMFLILGVFFFAKRENLTSANGNIFSLSTGDVSLEDANKINNAIDNFVTIQKQAQAEYKILEEKVNTAKQQIDSTIVEIVTKNGKDWRVETIIENDPKIRSYKFIKRDQPLPQPTPITQEEKRQEKK